MSEEKIPKLLSNKIGRNFALLFNRAVMYNTHHPFTTQSLADLNESLNEGFAKFSPIVFLMSQERFFIEEEPLDPRINTDKMLQHFKKSGLQSISFEKGMQREDLEAFASIFIDLTHYSNADLMKEALTEQGIDHIRINHVFFKKVTADDEVVDRGVWEEAQAAPPAGSGGGGQAALDIVAEHVLMAELEKSLSLSELLQNPANLSKAMIANDLSAPQDTEAKDSGYGGFILEQLQQINQKVSQAATADTQEASLPELAAAVFAMKKDLLKGIEAQKANGVIFVNESQIIEQSNEITDSVLVQLIRDEYKSGKISVKRLGQIIRRLIPDPKELQRLMPKIKSTLIEEGMPMAEFLDLTQELRKELQSEELTKVLERSAEEIGVSGQDLIHEINVDPTSAAELIYLASEIRKGTGDEKLLSNLLVDYIERVGAKIALDTAGKSDDQNDDHLRAVISRVETDLVKGLQDKDIDTGVIDSVEARLNSGLDDCLQQLKSELQKSKTAESGGIEGKGGGSSVLRLFEDSLEDDDTFKAMITSVRQSAENKQIDENNIRQIVEEISKIRSSQLNKAEPDASRGQSPSPAARAAPPDKPERAAHQAEAPPKPERVVDQAETPPDKPAQAKAPADATPAKATAATAKASLPAGVLNRKSILFFTEKEIFRSIRYGTPFSILLFSILKVTPQKPIKPGAVTRQQINAVMLTEMAKVFRETDIVGVLDNSKIMALLPMTEEFESKVAMRRILKHMHAGPLNVNDVPLAIQFAGSVTVFDQDRTPTLNDLIKRAENDIVDMVERLKNIQSIY